MTTMPRRDFDQALAAYDADPSGHAPLRFILISDDADIETLDAAMVILAAKKSRACIPSTKDEIQADIDQLLERRTALRP